MVTEDSVRGPAGRVAEPTNGIGEVSHNGAAVTPIYTCDETAQSYTRAQVKAGSGDRGPGTEARDPVRNRSTLTSLSWC